jgi:hypothetical protein
VGHLTCVVNHKNPQIRAFGKSFAAFPCHEFTLMTSYLAGVGALLRLVLKALGRHQSKSRLLVTTTTSFSAHFLAAPSAGEALRTAARRRHPLPRARTWWKTGTQFIFKRWMLTRIPSFSAVIMRTRTRTCHQVAFALRLFLSLWLSHF